MSTRARNLSMAVVMACLALTATARGALLEGQTIAARHLHQIAPDMTLVIGPIEGVVGPSVEFDDFGWEGVVDVDVSDTRIVITLNTNQPSGVVDVLVFTDPNGTIPDFTGVTVNGATNYGGFDASRVSLLTDSISVNLTGLQGLPGQQIVLDVAGGDTPPPPPPQPEPEVISLDIQPGACSNVLRTTGLLRVAIRGSASFDISQIDPVSLRLQGVAPVRSKIVDAAHPNCARRSDGLADYVLTFRAGEIIAALAPVKNGETRVLTLTGLLKEELGGTEIQAADSVRIQVTRGRKEGRGDSDREDDDDDENEGRDGSDGQDDDDGDEREGRDGKGSEGRRNGRR